MTDFIKVQEDLKPVQSLMDEAREIKITTAQGIEEAGYVLKKLSDSKKQVEDYRISMTKPLNESLRAINNFFKQFSEPLTDVDRDIRQKIKTFNEQFKEKETIDKRDYAEMSLSTRNKVGGVKLKKVWVFKIINIEKVPHEHFVLDETRIRNLIRAGERNIPGLEIYQDEQVSL